MFNQGTSGYSLSDIAAVSKTGDGLFGEGNGWWIILLFLFASGAWGGGFGGNNGVGAEVQRGFDTQSVLGKLDGITYGLSDGFYAVNSNLANRFAGVDNAICTLGYQNAQLINSLGNTVQSGQKDLSAQLAQCCCDTKGLIGDLRYQVATDTCGIQTTVAGAARDIIENGNANYRAIADRLTQMEINAKEDKIAALTAENQNLKFAASQCAQNAYLINHINPAPVPAYVVANPNCCYNACNC